MHVTGASPDRLFLRGGTSPARDGMGTSNNVAMYSVCARAVVKALNLRGVKK